MSRGHTRWTTCAACWPTCHARTAGFAEHAGAPRAFGLQRLLYQAVWDEDAARDAVRGFAVRYLAAPGAVLVFDETGQEKKGEATAGVGRQYTGTTGQVSNAVVAVYCTFASPLGHCLIDGDLYVQNHWAQDPDRCARPGWDGTSPSAPRPPSPWTGPTGGRGRRHGELGGGR